MNNSSSTARGFRYYTYIKPILQNPIVKTYGTPTFTIFAIAVFIIFAIKPTLETISVLQKKLQDSDEILARVNKKTQDLSQGRQNYLAIDHTVKEKINTAVPNKLLLQSLVDSLEQAALTNQASISALQIQPVTVSEATNSATFKLETIGFTFNAEGSFTNLIRVIEAIQESPRLILVDSLIFNKAVDSSTIVISVSGKAYYLR